MMILNFSLEYSTYAHLSFSSFFRFFLDILWIKTA